MKMKKALALGLATAMSVSMLGGCGSDASSTTTDSAATDKTTETTTDKAAETTDTTAATTDAAAEVEQVNLKIWVPEDEIEITQAMCEAFDEAHPEYECNFELAVVGVDESTAALTTDPDLAADIFEMPSGAVSQLVDAGLIYPITANIDDVKPLYGQGALDACSKDGLLYAIPATPNTWFMFYNKSLFTEDDVKSLETMMAKDLGSDVYNFSCAISNSWYLEAFFYAAGCTLYGEDGTDPNDCTWNNENGVAAANYVIELAKNPKYIEDIDGIAGSLMKEGKLGALCSGTWSAPELEEALGENFGACPIPTINLNGEERQLSNFADYRCFAVKSNTAHPMAAQLLVEWMNNEENQLTRYKEVKATPTCLSLQEHADVASDIATVALIAQTQYSTPQPAISQIDNYWAPVQALGEGIVNGEITSENVKEKLDIVVNDVTSTLAE